MDNGAKQLERLKQASLPGLPTAAPTIDCQLARTLSTRVSADGRLVFARRFTAAVVESYWDAKGLQPSLALPGGGARLGEAPHAAARLLGRGIAAASPDDVVHLIGAVYTSALPEGHRAQHGIFYTPHGLVDRLLNMAEAAGADWRTARTLDPACGGGAFLVAAAGRMEAALADVEPALALRQIGRRLRAFELDSFAAWLAQAMLNARLADLARRAGRPVPAMVDVRDSLELQPVDFGAFDVVVGNPPYGRISPLPERRAVFARSVYGHANLYGLFTDAALRWTAPGGLVAFVTPTSMLSGLYHKALRALLAREAPPIAVDLVAERSGVFDDVLQETMLAVYRRGGPPPARGDSVGQVSFLNLEGGGRAVSSFADTFSLPCDPEAPWLLPRTPGQAALARRLQAMPHRLMDYGYGVSTGPLVWNRHKPQLRTKKAAGSYPVVWAESVGADGRFAWRAGKRNHVPWFAADLPRDRWLLVDRPCVLLQRTTAKEQARRLIAAELPEQFIREHGAVAVENHLNMVRAVGSGPSVPPAAIAALLNSAASDTAFRCINGSVAVSAFELEAMPVPPPAVMRKVAELLGAGAPRSKIETVIAEAYASQAEDDVDAAAAAA